MLLIKQVKDLDNHLKRYRKKGVKIGFVPTMGALHKGHISLLETAKNQCKLNVCSIFVNPTQFNDKSDFEKYPITIDKDIEMLTDNGCDILFLPSVAEIYPNGLGNADPIDFGFKAQIMEGEHRPGHFDGMAQVVERLLRIVKPDKLFMGQKDYQQQLIIGDLIKKRKLKTQLVVCPTVREKDGLAMSSRNVRLDETARKKAVEISKTLKLVKQQVAKPKADIGKINEWALNRLKDIEGFVPEYFEIRNALTLATPKTKNEKLIALTAVQVGGVRLIDNMLIN